MDDLRKKIEELLNEIGAENESNTPDFVLSEYLQGCLKAFDRAVNRRDKWYGIRLSPGTSWEERIK